MSPEPASIYETKSLLVEFEVCLTSMGPQPSSRYDDGGFIKSSGFVGTGFPSSAQWSLEKQKQRISILYFNK